MKYTVDVPIIGYMTTTVEVDEENFVDARDVREAILDDDLEVPLDMSMLVSWVPVVNLRGLNECEFDQPFEVEVYK